jgi:hypothetical protein
MRVAVPVRVACAVIWTGVVFSACDTDAVGVEDCRDIERARCEAARFCDLRIQSDEDVEACKRFARDNCLHGLEVDDTPSSTDLSRCVDVIQAAGACAQESGAEALVSDCVPRTQGLQRVNGLYGACEVVATPEVAPQCQFLVAEPPEEPDAGSSEPDAGEVDAGQGDGG